MLTTVVQRILYDRRLQQGRMELREELGGTAGEEVTIRAGKATSSGRRRQRRWKKP
jgi:hypothetical protein